MTPSNLTGTNPTVTHLMIPATIVSLTATIDPPTKSPTSLLTSTPRHRHSSTKTTENTAKTKRVRPTKPTTVSLESGATSKSGRLTAATTKTTRNSLFGFFDQTTVLPTTIAKKVDPRNQPKQGFPRIFKTQTQ
uniref:Uncharacterized protein n=1 Tax=Ditylenchus dipsaci TaxID=166011 RepID=A0A915CWS3_9BILA